MGRGPMDDDAPAASAIRARIDTNAGSLAISRRLLRGTGLSQRGVPGSLDTMRSHVSEDLAKQFDVDDHLSDRRGCLLFRLESSTAKPRSTNGTARGPIAFVSKSGKPGDPVTTSGSGFRRRKRHRLLRWYRSRYDSRKRKWSDREVAGNVPTASKPGRGRVVVVPKGTGQRLVSDTEFEALAP
jgi:hypothetical protein